VAFPSSALPVVVELDLDGSGAFATDITSKTYVAEGVDIFRGRPNEAALSEPARCSLALNNRDGRFSPRKADGLYYGSLGRNTPLRVSITQATSHLLIDAATGTTPAAGARVTTPDSANLSIVGDIDIRFDADLTRWRGTSMDLVGKWTATAGQASYILVLESSGLLGLFWSTDGTALSFARSDAVLPRQVGRLAVRATLDVNNGASGNTATFYTSDTLSGSWTQLGSAIVQAGTTSIFDSTTAVTVLDTATGSQGNVVRGKVYGAQVLQGIGGTVRASPDFTAQTHGATSFADAQGNAWTLTGAVKLSTRDVRFVGEVPAWPVTWDLSQRNVRAPIEATGVMRRLQAGAPRLSSTARRAMLSAHANDANVVAYWPMEDGADSEFFASAIGGRPMEIFAGSPSLAAYDGFACSDPLPTFDVTTDLRGLVPSHAATGESQVRGLVSFPAAGLTNGVEILSVNYTGSADHWQVRYGTGGTLSLRCFDSDGTSLLDTGFAAFGVNGEDILLSVGLTQDGANIDYEIVTWNIADDTTGAVLSGTVNSQTIGRSKRVQWNTNGGADGISVGHTVVQTEVTSIFDRGDELRAHVGEQAVARITRLCLENGVTFQPWGGATSSSMGPQRSGTLMDLLRECERTDGGILFEARDEVAIAYRCRRGLFAQTAGATLDYDGRHLSGLQPVEDDDAIVNDVTVTRPGGASGRAVLESGALSVQPPPDGIGRYSTEVDANVQSDSTLDDQASWRLNVGTADEARFPQITVNLAHPVIVASTTLTAAVRRLEVGDKLVVEDPPAGWMPPEDIEQLAVGFAEEIGPKRHIITANCAPESPYHVGIFGGDEGGQESRYSAVGTVTAEVLDTTETGVNITTPSRFVGWGHGDGDYAIVIGGERMTVTGVTGTAPNQVLTVVRSANGIVKTHATGADVALARPVRYGL
jgi:hypothetical protein